MLRQITLTVTRSREMPTSAATVVRYDSTSKSTGQPRPTTTVTVTATVCRAETQQRRMSAFCRDDEHW
jgi:hypothetical protein